MNIKALATSLTATLIGCAAPTAATAPRVATSDTHVAASTEAAVAAEAMTAPPAVVEMTDKVAAKSADDKTLSTHGNPSEMMDEAPGEAEAAGEMAAKTETVQKPKVVRRKNVRRPQRRPIKEKPAGCGCGTCGSC